MHTLLLRLAGPMQSWGTDSKFQIRLTDREPSKSGVIGLCCAALGWKRDDDISDLAKLRMGVRIHKEGFLKIDFQTAMNVIKSTGKSTGTVISTRYYLADADFLVGLSSENLKLLKKIHLALQKPKWQIYLGRKSYVPSWPVFIKDGLFENTSLEESLESFPFPNELVNSSQIFTNQNNNEKQIECTFIYEVEKDQADQIRSDQPTAFSFLTRKFISRGVKLKKKRIQLSDSDPIQEENKDPWFDIEEKKETK
ncbi:MAG: type I-E CRISPR-associated protein Cas5/CasD [Candidatus Helarchaeota archaeon]